MDGAKPTAGAGSISDAPYVFDEDLSEAITDPLGARCSDGAAGAAVRRPLLSGDPLRSSLSKGSAPSRPQVVFSEKAPIFNLLDLREGDLGMPSPTPSQEEEAAAARQVPAAVTPLNLAAVTSITSLADRAAVFGGLGARGALLSGLRGASPRPSGSGISPRPTGSGIGPHAIGGISPRASLMNGVSPRHSGGSGTPRSSTPRGAKVDRAGSRRTSGTGSRSSITSLEARRLPSGRSPRSGRGSDAETLASTAPLAPQDVAGPVLVEAAAGPSTPNPFQDETAADPFYDEPVVMTDFPSHDDTMFRPMASRVSFAVRLERSEEHEEFTRCRVLARASAGSQEQVHPLAPGQSFAYGFSTRGSSMDANDELAEASGAPSSRGVRFASQGLESSALSGVASQPVGAVVDVASSFMVDGSLSTASAAIVASSTTVYDASGKAPLVSLPTTNLEREELLGQKRFWQALRSLIPLLWPIRLLRTLNRAGSFTAPTCCCFGGAALLITSSWSLPLTCAVFLLPSLYLVWLILFVQGHNHEEEHHDHGTEMSLEIFVAVCGVLLLIAVSSLWWTLLVSISDKHKLFEIRSKPRAVVTRVALCLCWMNERVGAEVDRIYAAKLQRDQAEAGTSMVELPSWASARASPEQQHMV